MTRLIVSGAIVGGIWLLIRVFGRIATLVEPAAKDDFEMRFAVGFTLFLAAALAALLLCVVWMIAGEVTR